MSTNYNHNARTLYRTSNPQGDSNTSLLKNDPVYPTAKKGDTTRSGQPTMTINGYEWKQTTAAQASGDPTEPDASSNVLKISIYTTNDNSANVFWGNLDYSKLTERGVRGIYLRHWNDGTNGDPKMKGVCCVYINDYGNKVYAPLAFGGESWQHSNHGGVNGTGTTKARYWGVLKHGSSVNAFHMKAYKWAGVLFHYQTSNKAGYAREQPIYISSLRPICDDGREVNPLYRNLYRVWGSDFK